jgi:hypothetical protein
LGKKQERVKLKNNDQKWLVWPFYANLQDVLQQVLPKNLTWLGLPEPGLACLSLAEPGWAWAWAWFRVYKALNPKT